MDDLNGYVILAGVLLIWGVLAYAGYTDLASRLRKRRSGRRERSVARRRRERVRDLDAARGPQDAK